MTMAITGRPNTESIKTKVRKDKTRKAKNYIQAVFRFINERNESDEISKVVENVTEARRWIREQQDTVQNSGIKSIRFQQTSFAQFAAEFAAVNIVPAKRTPEGKKYTGRKSYFPVISQLKFLTEFFGKMRVVDSEAKFAPPDGRTLILNRTQSVSGSKTPKPKDRAKFRLSQTACCRCCLK